MRVLVTGIAGFAGSHLAEYLVHHAGCPDDAPLEIHGVIHRHDRRIQHLRGRLHLHRGDLRNALWVSDLVQAVQPDVTLHLAAWSDVGGSWEQPWTTYELNIHCQLNLLEALRRFKGLPHRVQLIMEIGGVTFYDDSKGTNVGATVAALNGMAQKVVLIAGGDGKGQDFTPLRDAVARHARAAVLIGRDAALIQAALAGSGVSVERVADMETAVARAAVIAQPGDAVLLSPACASLDMFRNYAHRAEVFAAAVRRVPGVGA